MISEDLFGPEYANAVEELVATIKVGREPIDVIYEYGKMVMAILPPGGYVIRHIDGSFRLDTTPPKVVVGGPFGLKVNWRSSVSLEWNSIGLPADGQFHLELTRPHRIQLVPPENGSGQVKIRVLRYVMR